MNSERKKILVKKLPIVIEDNLFIYPFMIVPIFLTKQKDIDAIKYAKGNNIQIFLAMTKDKKEGSRKDGDIYPFGVIGNIMRVINLPDGRVKILFQGLIRGAKVSTIEDKKDNKLEFQTLLIEEIKEETYNKNNILSLLVILKEKLRQFSKMTNKFPQELLRTIYETKDPYRITDLISSLLKIEKIYAYEISSELNIEKRLSKLIDYIIDIIESTAMQDEIRSKVHINIDKNNRGFILKEQLKEITKELGRDNNEQDDEISIFKKKLYAIKKVIDESVYKEIDKQINRFSKMQPESSDANVLEMYLELVFEIPFGNFSKKNLKIEKIENQLNKEHFSLKDPKDRIVEFFAVKELASLRGINLKNSGAILCFIGPPGVGKTSLANSIATALDKPLIRIALGGLEDVSELRGHRRTYVAAMPGRIVQGLISSKTMDPVIVLDEIDKVGRNYNGDPGSVLLELLDPEQNKEYRDYYLNFNIDLSKVVFIATANSINKISAPLRDRMEFISLNSYTPNEKFKIAKQFLIPQELKKHALRKYEFNITDSTLKILIDEYTRESGVRKLRQKIASLMRKSITILLKDPKIKNIRISLKNLKEFVDKKVFQFTTIDENPSIGIVNGLAWTSLGGDMLQIEAIKIKGKGLIQLTGTLGEVMKESAKISFSVVKLLIDQKILKINNKDEKSLIYDRYNIHLHIPEGATPKDGPSAGITMAVAIASILSDKKVNNKVAMTGELTLTGKVLPIGGLKEKLIAAYKAGITTALIPKENYELDLEELPDEVKENIKIIPVERIEEVIEETLLRIS